MDKKKDSLLPTIGVIVATLLWSTSFISMKLALRAYHPMTMIFGRMAIASLVFLLFSKKLRQCRYHKGDWKYLLLMALCEPCFYFVFESYAMLYTTASQAGMVSSLMPLLVAFGSTLLLRERLGPTTIPGLLIAISGIGLISFQGVATESAPNPLWGNGLEFIAMGFAAGYTILGRFLGRRYSAFVLSASQMFIGTLFFLPMLFLPSTQLPTTFALVPTLSIFYLGAFVSFGAYSLFNYGLQNIPASQASVFINLIPVFSVFFAWLILEESLTRFQSVGMLIVLCGVSISTWNPRRRQLRLRSSHSPV